MSRLVNKFHTLEEYSSRPNKSSRKKMNVETARMRYMILTQSYIHPNNLHIPFYPSSLRYFEKNMEAEN